MAVHSLVLAAAWLLMNTVLVFGSPVGDCPPVDPLDHTDHLPDDKNCSLFYKCDHAAPVLFACPEGLHFNRLLEVCDWPDAAGCTGSHGNTSPAAPTDSPNTGSTSASTSTDKPASDESNTVIPPKECPAIGSCTQYEDEKSIAKHLPHATNCSQFCKCDHGKPVTFDCPAGLHFNAILEVCDWPQNAGCSAKPSTEAPATSTKPTTAAPITTAQPIKPTTALPSTTAESTTAARSTTVKPTTSAPVSSSTTEPSPPATSDPSRDCPAVGVCPQYEDEKSIAKHLPHASNCSLFCKCDHGKPVTFDCPAGLHFNAILEVCDWPQNAGCSAKPTTAAPGTTAKPTTSVPITSAKPTTAAPSTTAKPTTAAPTTSAKPTTAAPITTAQAIKPTTALPSTTAEATTAARSTTVKPTTSAPVSSSTAKPSPPATSDLSGDCPAVGVCPQYGDEKSIAKHLPHASNCSQFCKCDHGKPVTFDCPSGLHFNAILEVCDWPQNAGCTAKPTTAAPVTTAKSTTSVPITSAKPTTTAPSTTAKPTTAVPTTSAKPTTAAPITTAQPIKPTTALPSTTADATSAARSTTVKPTTSAPVSSSTAESSPPATPEPLGDCPAVGVCPQYEDEKSIAKHLPHASNCSQFCKCDHGKPVIFDCPAGLHFNAILEVCDWPQSAGCSANPTTAAPNTSAEPSTHAPNTTVEPTTATPTTSVKPSTAVPSTTVVPTSSAPSFTVEPCDAVGSCPVYDEHSIVKHLPHRTNCGLYCRCNHGVPITEKCPDGLHFNAVLEVCDWPSAAGCE